MNPTAKDVQSKLPRQDNMITGPALARQLLPYIGATEAISSTCFRIVLSARRYARMLVEECSGYFRDSFNDSDEWSAWVETTTTQLEAEVADLVHSLPSVDGEHFKIAMGGDCRGPTVVLICQDGKKINIA